MSFGTTYTIPEHTRRQFQDSFEAAIQQNDAKFASVTNVDPKWTAKQYVKRMRDTQEWFVNNARFGANTAREFEAGFRSGFWQNLDMRPIKFDRGDQKLLDTIALPTGEVIQDSMKALNRLRDDLFITAATADSLGGSEPYITPTAFPASQVIPVNYVKPGQSLGSNSGLHIWKILNARTRFQQLQIDFDREDMVLAISPDDETYLVLAAEAAPNEAWAKVVLDWFMKRSSGDMEAKLFNFRVITTTRLNVASSITTCLAFVKRAFCWAPINGVETHIDIGGPETRHAITVSAYANFGVFRVFDEMVLEIPCYNA